ncbi:Ion-translocating oxidoreductase complex subunit C [Streptomyces californicus]
MYTVTGGDWDEVVESAVKSDDERIIVNMNPQHPSPAERLSSHDAPQQLGAADPETSHSRSRRRGSDDVGSRDPQRHEPKLLRPALSAFGAESWTLETYRRHEGYEALRKALAMDPDELIAYVKDSGLRGRGGAGFPTGMKWQFIPQGGDGKPHYLVVNADSSEPGTCKDIPLLFANPHSLIEGIVIACYAIRSSHAFIYLRGEVVPVLRRLARGSPEA